MYMFGGQDRHGKKFNDLWLISPFYKFNQKLLSNQLFEYVSKPTLCLTIKEITDFKGKAPCPRINASSCIVRNNKGEHLLIIHGG